MSNISVEFNLDVALEDAASDVRDKVGQATRNLPQDIDAPPVVSKADANSDMIIILAVQSRTRVLLDLSDYAENVLQQQLQTINGVSGINLLGNKRYAMRLKLDPARLDAFNVTFQDVATALAQENVELPAGKIAGNSTDLTIRTIARFSTEEQFRDLIIRQDATGTVRLSDVGTAALGPETYEQQWKLNGAWAVGLGVIPQPGANYIQIADEFYKRLAQIEKENKGDIQLRVLIDNTRLVRQSLYEVVETLLISFSLVVLVIFAFFRSWLIALRPLIDIPISLIATFFVMYLAGFTLNILTLLGIVLATGLVVDDGIVVTENIFRKLEGGMPIRQAAREGSKEVFFAVIVTSLTLAVVFLPVVFLQGFTGRLFREFGVVVAGAVLISALVSLTITPVLNVVLHRGGDDGGASHGWLYRKTEPFFERMESGYAHSVGRFLRVRWLAWVIVLVCGGVIWLIGRSLPSELAPLEDRSSLRLSLTAPQGSSFEFTRNVAEDISSWLNDSIPEADFTFNLVPGFGGGQGLNSGFVRLGMVPPDERKRSQAEVAAYITKRLPAFNDARVFVVQEQTISVGLSSRAGLPVQFVLQNLDLEKIQTTLPGFLAAARQDPTFASVDANLKFDTPELRLTFDRFKIRDLGLTTEQVASTVQGAFGGRRLAYFLRGGRQYQVIGLVGRADRSSPEAIPRLNVRNARGEAIPLAKSRRVRRRSTISTA